MCGKTLGQLFEAVEEKIEALEERVEQLEAEQRAPLTWDTGGAIDWEPPYDMDDLRMGY